MKIRQGFVSNSSSSSFLLKFEGDTKEYMKTVITEDVFTAFKEWYDKYMYEPLENNYCEIYCADDLADFIIRSVRLHEINGTYTGFKLIAHGGDGPDDYDNIWYVLSNILNKHITYDESY